MFPFLRFKSHRRCANKELTGALAGVSRLNRCNGDGRIEEELFTDALPTSALVCRLKQAILGDRKKSLNLTRIDDDRPDLTGIGRYRNEAE